MNFLFGITPFPFSFYPDLLFKIKTIVYKKEKWFTLRILLNFLYERFLKKASKIKKI